MCTTLTNRSLVGTVRSTNRYIALGFWEMVEDLYDQDADYDMLDFMIPYGQRLFRDRSVKPL